MIMLLGYIFIYYVISRIICTTIAFYIWKGQLKESIQAIDDQDVKENRSEKRTGYYSFGGNHRDEFSTRKAKLKDEFSEHVTYICIPIICEGYIIVLLAALLLWLITDILRALFKPLISFGNERIAVAEKNILNKISGTSGISSKDGMISLSDGGELSVHDEEQNGRISLVGTESNFN